MSIFDFFTTPMKQSSDSKKTSQIGKPINMRETNGGAMEVFHPQSFDDVQKVIETLKANHSAIVYLTHLKYEDAQRALDLLSGAIFALDGGIMQIENGIYIFTLDGLSARR